MMRQVVNDETGSPSDGNLSPSALGARYEFMRQIPSEFPR